MTWELFVFWKFTWENLLHRFKADNDKSQNVSLECEYDHIFGCAVGIEIEKNFCLIDGNK